MTGSRNAVPELAETLLSCGWEENEAWSEAEIIAAELCGLAGSRLPAAILSEEQRRRASAILERRKKHEPLQYILGHAPFMDLDLEVTPAVLIPRCETEILCEKLISALPRGGTLLDVGTGSGAIALSVAFARPDVQVLAVDISEAALEVAERNAKKYALANVMFRLSDLGGALKEEELFDRIAANLPYVSGAEYAWCAPEITQFEPKLALVAEENGLALEKRAARELKAHLKPGGELIFEFSPEQREEFTADLQTLYSTVRVEQDYCGRDRFIACACR